MASVSILVVDDNKVIRNMLHKVLESEGYEVTSCSDGHSAQRLAEKKQFEIVLTCQMSGHRLPDSNGPICQDIGYPRLIRDSSGSKSSGIRYSNVSTMSFPR
jgi:two-component system OmpR family response regulator